MKKHKSFKLAEILLFCLIFASLISCKSTPDLAPVEPLELLDGDAALYLSIPVQANAEFLSSAIQKIAGLEPSDAQKITERLDLAHVALGRDGELQFSASGKIPTSFLGFALNEKKGWSPGVREGQTFYTHKQSLYQLCLPSSSNAFLSHNIDRMIRRFNKIAWSESSASDKLLSESLGEKQYQFLHDIKSSDILLYAPLPKAFISSFLGKEINFPLESIYAILSQYRGVKEQFNVSLTLNLSDSRTTKACAALLKTSLFGVPAKVFQSGQKQITITDLPLTQKRILSMIR